MSGKNSGSYLVGYGTHVTQQYMVLLSEALPNILQTALLEVTFTAYIDQINANTQKLILNKAHSNTHCQIIFCGYQQGNVRFSYSWCSPLPDQEETALTSFESGPSETNPKFQVFFEILIQSLNNEQTVKKFNEFDVHTLASAIAGCKPKTLSIGAG